MKNNFLFVLIIIFLRCASAYGQSVDSVQFSSDGQYVLMKEEDSLNICPIKWWSLYHSVENKSEYYITFSKDSVYFLIFSDTAKTLEKFPCNGVDIKIAKKYALPDFKTKYNFTPASLATSAKMHFKTDTIRTYYRPYKWPENAHDTSKYFDISAQLYNDNQLLFSDTISTNFPEADFSRFSSNYTVYYSSDKSFCFVYGYYYYLEIPEDNNGLIKRIVRSNKIMKNDRR